MKPYDQRVHDRALRFEWVLARTRRQLHRKLYRLVSAGLQYDHSVRLPELHEPGFARITFCNVHGGRVQSSRWRLSPNRADAVTRKRFDPARAIETWTFGTGTFVTATVPSMER